MRFGKPIMDFSYLRMVDGLMESASHVCSVVHTIDNGERDGKTLLENAYILIYETDKDDLILGSKTCELNIAFILVIYYTNNRRFKAPYCFRNGHDHAIIISHRQPMI